MLKNKKIAIIGLGYVGLPLAVEFGKKCNTKGYDIDDSRIIKLNENIDIYGETTKNEIKAALNLHFTSKIEEIKNCNVYIITVPTPVDENNIPNISILLSACEKIGTILNKNDTIIFESTVYPGCTEEDCVPVLEKYSNLKYNKDFFCGYSPERINPGDTKRTLTKIVKVTSGSNSKTAKIIDEIYSTIITAGTYMASSIKVAEAAKVIENTQRDINIALINELSMIFNKLDINTQAVLEAAGTKWNFLPFQPGLVGGHCIGIDPYYLTHKAIEVGYHPEMILAGRRLNDNMSSYVVDQVTKLMLKKRIHVEDANILIMGLTFKENCPDYRNTRVIDLIKEFESFNCNVDVYDPWVNKKHVADEYKFCPIDEPKKGEYDAIVIAVMHNEFKSLSEDLIRSYGKKNHVLYDIKYLLKSNESDGRL